jgi:hypothetical protein
MFRWMTHRWQILETLLFVKNVPLDDSQMANPGDPTICEAIYLVGVVLSPGHMALMAWPSASVHPPLFKLKTQQRLRLSRTPS